MDIECDKIEYRMASIDDVEALVTLRVRFLNELYDHSDDDETKILRESLGEYFSEAIPSNDFIAYLAEYEGRVVGTGGMVLWERPANYGALLSGKLAYLLNFYTIPEARKKGICTRLLEELVKEAKSLGLKYLHLNATEEGRSIYRKAGFIEPDDVELELRI